MPEDMIDPEQEKAVANYLSLCRRINELLCQAAQAYGKIDRGLRPGLGMPPHPARYILPDHVPAEGPTRR